MKATRKGFWKSFRVYDLILVAMLTALSIAMKAVAGTLVRMVTGPLGIPGGTLAGGFYMLWLPLAVALTGKRGAALVVAILQTVIMITTGAPGSHGIWTLITYTIPALPVEIIMFSKKKGYNILHFLFAAACANIAGTYLTNQALFRLSFYPLMFTLLAAAFSGALGGVVAYFVYAKAAKNGFIKKAIPPRQESEAQETTEPFSQEHASAAPPPTEDNTDNETREEDKP